MLRPAATKSRTMTSGHTIGAKNHSHHAVGELSFPNLTNGIRMPYNVVPFTGRGRANDHLKFSKRPAAALQCNGGLCTACRRRGDLRLSKAGAEDLGDASVRS